MKRPMILAAILSAVLSLILHTLNYSAIVLGAGAIALLFIGSLFIRKLRIFSAVFVVLLVVIINAAFVSQNKINAIEKIDENTPVMVTGTVTSEYYGKGVVIYNLKTDGENVIVPKGINISLRSRFAVINAGDTVKCNIYLKSIPQESKSRYYSSGVYAFGSISKVIETSRKTSLNSLISDFRSRVTNIFYKYLSTDSAASINALTIGDKYYIEPDFDLMVKRSGVSHVMVVSGMHMAVICGAFLKLLRYLKFGNRLSSIITAVFVFLFMALCGFSMSVLRSGITYFIMLLSLFLLRRSDPLNSLCVALSVIIMINPFSMSNISLQLSALSTAGIIILSGPIENGINKALKISAKPFKFVTSALSVTLSALIFTFPLTVYYFGGVSTVVIITNLLIGQAVTAVLILSSMALIFAIFTEFSLIANGLFFFSEYITKYFNFIINYFGGLNFSWIRVNTGVTIMSYLAIILIFVIIKYIENIKKAVSGFANSFRTNA